MKVTRREVLLLIFLIAAGAVYLLYTFLYSPMLSDISQSKLELAASQQKLATYEQMLKQGDLAKLEQEQLDALAAVDEKAAPLLPNLEHNRILSFINDIAISQYVAPFSVALGDQGLVDTAPVPVTAEVTVFPMGALASTFRGVADTAAAPTDTTAAPPGTQAQASDAVVNQLAVKIHLDKVTYAQVLSFIKKLESYNRAIYIKDIAVDAYMTDFGFALQADLTYTFNQTDKLTDTDEGLSTLPNLANLGKYDPFQR